MIVADTDVLIDFLQGREPAAARVARELERGRLVTTVVTRFELLAGARSERQRASLQRLLAAVRCLALDPPGADRAAAVRTHLESKGEPIGMADSLIAGIVLEHGATLLTRNRRHFDRVPDLPLGKL